MPTTPVLRKEPERAEHTTSSRAERAGLRFFAAALIICFCLYLIPFVVLRTVHDPSWTTSYWGQVIDTSYNTAHQDADVVIFGDSTAATNFDPSRMSRDLGLKVLVLPNVSTSLPVTGFSPLEQYLRNNKPPRLIIFYLSGWDLDFLHNPFTQIDVEGEEMLLRHGSWSSLAHYARKNVHKVLLFPLHFYASSNHLADLVYFRGHEAPEVKLGHIVQLAHESPMSSNCEFDKTRLGTSAPDASVREGVQQFTTPQTKTVVVISPLPDCKHLEIMRNIQHPGLDIPSFQVLPPSSFRDDGWQAHMRTEDIGPSTEYLEGVVRSRLATRQTGQ